MLILLKRMAPKKIVADQFNPNYNLAKFGDMMNVACDDIDES